MLGVEIKDNESVERAINRFKKMVTRSRILNEYKDRQQFTKPSIERREAMKRPFVSSVVDKEKTSSFSLDCYHTEALVHLGLFFAQNFAAHP